MDHELDRADRGPIAVLIADDEPEVRAALAALIQAEPRLRLVGAAVDAEEAIELAGRSRPDVAVVDVRMPGGGGARATRGILRASPGTRVLALSAYEDRATVLEMLRAGAVGYLVKGTSPDEIVRAIGRAAVGQTSLSAAVMPGVVQELSEQLRREELALEERRARRERVRRAIAGEGLSLVFQPIFDLRERRPVGVEALARFSLEPLRSPAAWFSEAAEEGMGVELELTAIRLALAHLDRIPTEMYLSLNLSHATLRSERAVELLSAAGAPRLVVEITEHEPVDDYDRLADALAGLRRLGVRIAIDDAGAGFASLRHILRLDPDLIKLDISLTRDIDTDRRRRALASALASFAEEMGMAIVAEGIETEAELEVLLRLGVGFGQGFFLAKPAPLGQA